MGKLEEINKEQYYSIVGILQLAGKYNESLGELERLIATILDADEDNVAGSYGHISDAIYGETNIDDMLKWMGIKYDRH